MWRAGRNDKDESFDVLRPAASFAADKRWPFPSLDAQRMKGVGIRPCSVFGADSRAENPCVAGSPPLGPHARPATPPALVSSGFHRCFHQATPATGGEDARLDTVQTHTCSPHEEGKPQETKRSVLPETPGVGRGHSEADDSQAPILVYMPLVKNEVPLSLWQCRCASAPAATCSPVSTLCKVIRGVALTDACCCLN